MKNLYIYIFIIIVIPFSILSAREISGTSKVENYRPQGEMRVWTFIIKDSTIGSLISTVKEEAEIDDVKSYVIEEKLKLDYQKIGSSLKMNIRSKHFISEKGFYLGDEMKLNINDENEELRLKRSGDKLEGYTTRGGEEIEQSHRFKTDGFAVENNFIDQYELFLAMRDIRVGDIIEDSVFMPQAMIKANVKAVVEDFINLQVYNEVFDSAFVIHYSEPQEQFHYFTPDKRLIKAVIPSQDIKVYLDAVRQIPLPRKPGGLLDKPLKDLAQVYVIYLLFGVISLIFFIQQGYRWPISYLGLFAGGLMYILIIFTQIPWQISIVKKVMIPHISDGGSPYVWGLLPAIMAGIIQEILKAVSIIIISLLSRLKDYKYAIVGAMCGVGFAIVEASYLTGKADISQLFGLSLMERGFMILFHTASGALLGYAYSVSIKNLSLFIVLTVIVNSIFRYLPIFAQYNRITVEVLNLLLAFISISFLFGITLLFKKKKSI